MSVSLFKGRESIYEEATPNFLPTKMNTAPAGNMDARSVLEREGVEVFCIVQSHSERKSGPPFNKTPRRQRKHWTILQAQHNTFKISLISNICLSLYPKCLFKPVPLMDRMCH